MSSKRGWEIYEDATTDLLNNIRDQLGLRKIGTKQKVKGKSGTEWEVDVVVYNADDGRLVLVECKRRSKSTLPQKTLAELAYKIDDTDAARGIIVTTIGLQEGAKKIAKAEKITEIKLDLNATTENYIAQIANQIFIKNTDKLAVKEHLEIEVHDKSSRR